MAENVQAAIVVCVFMLLMAVIALVGLKSIDKGDD